jgi:hypothetical protein
MKYLLIFFTCLGVWAQGTAPTTRFNSVADMVAATIYSPTTIKSCILSGYYSANDGGGGIFYIVANQTSTNTGIKIASSTAGFSWNRERGPSDGVNVKWFGAKGDGVTDDRVAIKAAIDAVNTIGGGVVFFPTGTYVTSQDTPSADWVTIPSGVTLKGENVQTTIIKTKVAPADNYAAIFSRGTINAGIENMTLQGYKAAAPGAAGNYGIGVYLQGTTNFVGRNLILKDFWFDGFSEADNTNGVVSRDNLWENILATGNRRQGGTITASDGTTVRNSVFELTGGASPEAGMDVEPNSSESVMNLRIEGCRFSNNTGNGLYLNLGSGITITNVVITDATANNNGVSGVQLQGATDVSIVNLVTTTNTLNGLGITTSTNITSSGGEYSYNVNVGIRVSNHSRNISLTGGASHNNGDHGIELGASASGVAMGVVIDGLHSHSNGGDGINLRGVGNVVSNCLVDRNNKHGIDLISQDHGIIIGNQVSENSQLTHNTYSGIVLSDSSSWNRIDDNTIAWSRIYNDGVAQAGGASTVTISANSSAVDDIYNTLEIVVSTNSTTFQTNTITDYVAATKVVTVSTPWGTTPAVNWDYIIRTPKSHKYGIISATAYNNVAENNTFHGVGTAFFSDGGTSNQFTGISWRGLTSGTVTVKPAAAAGTYTLTLPTTDGAASEFLQTDGAGVLTWAAAGGASALSALTAAVAGNSINNGDNAQTWNASLTTAGRDFLTISENVASTATGDAALLQLSTIAASTAIPLLVDALGVERLRVRADGTYVEFGQTTGMGMIKTSGAGTAAAPTWSFFNNSNLGVYRVGADAMGFVSAGATIAQITSGGLRFQAVTLGTTAGDTGTDSTQKTLATYQAGVKQALQGVIFTATADASVTNTMTGATILGTGVGTKTLPANFFVAGKTVRVKWSGVYSSDAVTPGTMTVDFRLGGNIEATSAAFTMPTSGNSSTIVEGELTCTCRTTGASGTMSIVGWVSFETSTAGSDVRFAVVNGSGNQPAVADTTAALAIDVQADWGTADADNGITVQNVTIEVLN